MRIYLVDQEDAEKHQAQELWLFWFLDFDGNVSNPLSAF